MRQKLLLTVVVLVIIAVTGRSVRCAESAKEDSKAKSPPTNALIVDPETGLQFRKARSLVGKQDIIGSTDQLSPNGKFLLDDVRVVPIEDGEPFQLVDFPAYRGVWSPDGSKVAFYSAGIWVIPVSPETGKPTGPPRKLVDGNYWYNYPVAWSPDSKSFAYTSPDLRGMWTYSVEDGSKLRIAHGGSSYARPSWSPDAKWIAYQGLDGWTWLCAAKGGTPRKLVHTKGVIHLPWSPDSNWIVCPTRKQLIFVRVADGRRIEVTLPEEVGQHLPWSGDGHKLVFYKSSYDWRISLKIVHCSGGAPMEPLSKLLYSGISQRWTADSKFVATNDWERYWVVPIAGGDPFALELNVQVKGKLLAQSISPDGKKLLFFAETDAKREYWVVPISIDQGRSTGAPAKIFDEPEAGSFQWSPDGEKLTVVCEGDIWIASADGSPPVRLTETPEREIGGDWDRDGRRIIWLSYSDSADRSVLYVCEPPHGKPKKLIEVSGQLGYRGLDGGTKIAYTVDDREKVAVWVIAFGGGEPKKLMELEGDRRTEFTYALSPNGRELALVLGDKVSAFSLPDGERREIADFHNAAWSLYPSIHWSPDGRTLAILLYPKSSFAIAMGERTRIFTVPASGGEWTELAADDKGDKYSFDWSPDGKWIAYSSDGMVKTRSESILWEVEITEFLKRTAEKASAGSSASED
jgi:Tol biopolymer transport system component